MQTDITVIDSLFPSGGLSRLGVISFGGIPAVLFLTDSMIVMETHFTVEFYLLIESQGRSFVF